MPMRTHEKMPGLLVTVQGIAAQVNASSDKCKEIGHRQCNCRVDHPLSTLGVGTELEVCHDRGLAMRLSDTGLHQRQTKALYPHHQPLPWPTEDATRGRSNRLLAFALPLFLVPSE